MGYRADEQRGAPFSIECGAALFIFAAFMLQGCAGSEVMEVNKTAIAHRRSHTDPQSLALARQSFALAGDLTTDYRVGPEDMLEISIFEWELRGETRTVEARVEESGAISLPILGGIAVGGLTVEEIKERLEAGLIEGGILRAPRVHVAVKEFRSKRVAVVGYVNEPGVYTLRQNCTTLLAILTLAGGLREGAGQLLYIIRDHAPEDDADAAATASPGKEVVSVDLYELLEQGRLELNMVLQNSDIVNVPEAKQFYVVGFVQKPGGFPLSRPVTVLEGIALAGGLREREASPSECMLKRQAEGRETIIRLDLVAISRGKKQNLYLMPDDVIDVRQTAWRKFTLGALNLFREIFNVGYTLDG